MNNDLISRSEIKKAFDDYSKTNPNLSGIFEVGKFIIDNAPTVIPDIEEFDKALHKWFEEIDEWEKKNGKIRPQGEWVYNQGSLKCSRCGYADNRNHKANSNYCSNCGADMRKGGAE